AFKLFKVNRQNNFNQSIHVVSPFKKVMAGLGAFVSLIFIGLLLIPGSPAFLGIQSRIALAVWVVLGVIFYLLKRKELHMMDKEELNYLILGSKKIQAKNQD